MQHKSQPDAPGFWWVWTKNWPCCGAWYPVEVVADNTPCGFSAQVPAMDFADELGADTWDGALWEGPIEAPALPTVKD